MACSETRNNDQYRDGKLMPKTVDFKHPEWEENKDRWKLIDDICDAKNLKDHLVTRNPEDKTRLNKIRNLQIFKRAVFYNIAGYTARGLVGKVFTKAPEIKLPDGLDYVRKNIDGSGLSLVQQAQETMKEVVRKGRCFLWADMVKTDRELSQADLATNHATVTLYKASQVINWKTTKVGSQIILSQVVLALFVQAEGEDGFSFENVPIRLELSLINVDGDYQYTVTEWRQAAKNKEEWIPVDATIPLDGSGKPFNRIPGIFVGSDTNNTEVDIAPMYDLCMINKGHYNNSAIYEDSVYLVGQAQPWMSGLTQDLLDLMNNNNMYVGSGRMLGVPAGEQFAFAQVQPNTLSKEAMSEKEQLMISLGAQLIQPGTVAKTATQSAGEQVTSHSVLSLIAANVSEAYQVIMTYQAQFMNVTVTDENLKFEINQDFVDPNIDSNMLREMIAGFLSGAIPATDYHQWLKKQRLTNPDKELEEFQSELSGPEDNIDLDEEDANSGTN